MPGCPQPQNPATGKVCQSCGSKLLLKERYRPIQAIGQGGFGRTFLARDEDIPSKPKCVVKQLFFNQGQTRHIKKAEELFYQEAVRLDELGHHPQIPTLLAHFEQNQWLYLVQEFIAGPTLSRELKERGAFKEAQVRQALADLLRILAFIHDRQIIHRDIKPANIIRRTGAAGAGEGQLILIDFGIAKLLSATAMMQTGTIIGSPEYMAPEQTRGKVVPASDIYSLGVTCLHLLTGVSPANLYDEGRDRWIWRDFLTADKLVSAELGRILDKMVQAATRVRYASAAQVLRDLEPLPSPAIAPSPSPATQSPPRPVTRSPSPQPVSPTSAPAQPIKTFKRAIGNLFSSLAGHSTPDETPDILISEAGLDYTRLRDLLARKKWKLADEETRAALCQAVGKPPRGYLFEDDLANLPCEDLQTIDRLWVKYSDARFGFSVQARIYEGCGKDYGTFCDRIGWVTYRPAVPYKGIKFTLTAPIGHLPSRVWSGGTKWWRHAEAMANRLAECETNESQPS